MRAVGALLRKDLRAELRTGETVPAMCLFAVTTFVIFHFALDRDSVAGDLAAGVLWVTVLFASVLGINRLFVAEREQGGFDGFLLAPVDRTAMLGAKVLALLAFLALVELVAVPAFASPAARARPRPGDSPVLALTDIGLAATGALTSAMAVNSRARDLRPAGALPLFVPLMVAATGASSTCWRREARHTYRFSPGWRCSLYTILSSAWSPRRCSTSCWRTE